MKPQVCPETRLHYRALWTCVVASISLFFSNSVFACATCFSGVENREAFYLTTALLMLLPITMVGSISFWIIRQYRKQR